MIRKVNEILVEWDDFKSNLNMRKHGIDFEIVAFVFADTNRIDFYDFKHSETEPRYLTIRMVNKILTVVYTERVGALRIISARPATVAEREQYYDNYQKNN